MPADLDRARDFLAGEQLSYGEADGLWQRLAEQGHLSLARGVLERLRETDRALLDRVPRSERLRLCRQHALLTSKDRELNAAVRHDRALEILEREFDLEDETLEDGETLGIAAGIHKRRWMDLGQIEDLQRAAALYDRGSRLALGRDASPHINAAFLEDLLAAVGDRPEERHARSTALRRRILEELAVDPADWWNAATRAEAHFGLGNYSDARQALDVGARPAPWQLETTARQLAALAHLRERRPLENPEVREVFEALLGDSADAVRSAFVGKVGLALSGGGFRASFFHLGVMARLAELDVLRHVEVLSCVSGGSIVGACYWLALRKRLLDSTPMTHSDYLSLVVNVIEHFEAAAATDLRDQAGVGRLRTAWRFARGARGAIDPTEVALALETHFYRPLFPGEGRIFMHELPFTPVDHDTELAGSRSFQPDEHNWLRAHKVPSLVINATTINTGHSWVFTPTWMGESPWTVQEAADSVPRLEWSRYEPDAGWRATLGEAVAASACVPGVFEPLRIDPAHDDMVVELVDGGVFDNQGTAALLAQSCNVVLVSDAAGQLMLERRPAEGAAGLAAYAKRSMDTLMERVRQANYGDLSARRQMGLLRGLMFLHMKAGLDADLIRLPFSRKAYQVSRSVKSPSGLRKDFQQALSELRTDLDAFSLDESRSLMACGYQMASKEFERQLGELVELVRDPVVGDWPFKEHLEEITSTAAASSRRDALLDALREGSTITV